jgi:hypothetical protein
MQKIVSQRGTGPPGDIMSEHRATSSRNARATSSESRRLASESLSKGPDRIHLVVDGGKIGDKRCTPH